MRKSHEKIITQTTVDYGEAKGILLLSHGDPMEPTANDTWFILQPYLDEDIFVVSCHNNDYERSAETAFLDLRNILQVWGLYRVDSYWAFSVLYRFQPGPSFFHLEYNYRFNKDEPPVPSVSAKRQHEDLLKAWMACRRKYTPKAALEGTETQTSKENP
jgi:hypothetical protein